jgi:hypothetical protein
MPRQIHFGLEIFLFLILIFLLILSFNISFT